MLAALGASAATVRLNKRMAELGLCSRREADAWIERGWVRVNGTPAVMGQPVALDARIDIDRQAEQQQRLQVTILINKPVGYVSGQAEDGHETAGAQHGRAGGAQCLQLHRKKWPELAQATAKHRVSGHAPPQRAA